MDRSQAFRWYIHLFALTNLRRHPLFLLTAVVATAAAIYVAVAVNLGLVPFSGSEFTGLNVEVLVDNSAVMNEPLSSDLTKLEAAVKAVRSQVFNERVADTDKLALRQFGGSCQSEGTQLAQSQIISVSTAVLFVRLRHRTTSVKVRLVH